MMFGTSYELDKLECRFENLQRRHESLRDSFWILYRKHQLLLEHLGLEEYENPQYGLRPKSAATLSRGPG